MADINRDDAEIELAYPPRFSYGERVIARSVVRNDGTYNGRDIGEVLVNKGEIGYVININTFLQQFYIYAVDFVESGHRVGMRAKELCTLDNLPDEVLAQLGEKAGALRTLGSSKPSEDLAEQPEVWPRQQALSSTNSVSKSFVSRREAAGSANARQGEATTTRMI
jgi:nitrogen fixation protein NifZ